MFQRETKLLQKSCKQWGPGTICWSTCRPRGVGCRPFIQELNVVFPFQSSLVHYPCGPEKPVPIAVKDANRVLEKLSECRNGNRVARHLRYVIHHSLRNPMRRGEWKSILIRRVSVTSRGGPPHLDIRI